MIPYISIPVFQLGPIPIDPWGTLVCIAFVVGMEVARARAVRLGLDTRDIIDGLVFTVLMGFVGGHTLHVLAYNPHQLQEQGIMALVRLWAGFSSFGGFIGAVTGAVVFYRWLRPRPFWLHADTIMYGFPFAWVFGRLGCFSVHDHVGRRTDFFLAVDFPKNFGGVGMGGPRFDLGLLEALWTMVIAAAFFVTGRRERPPTFFVALWCVMYAPMRFFFDFLRNTDLKTADVRWAGLTPAQWGCFVMLGAGLVLFMRLARSGGGGGEGGGGWADWFGGGKKKEPPLERRAYYRVHTEEDEARVMFRTGAEHPWRERIVLDLSGGGLAFRLWPREDGDLRVGTILDAVELDLTGEDPIVCRGEIRAVGVARAEEQLAGVAFVGLPEGEQARIFRWIREKERVFLEDRREARHPLGPAGKGAVVLRIADTPPRVRRLLSIGFEGAEVALSVREDTDIEEGMPIREVVMHIPQDTSVRLAARVTRLETDDIGRIKAHLKFAEVPPEHQERLERFLRRFLPGAQAAS